METSIRDGSKSAYELGPRGKTGRVVPFFPTDWNKNANSLFNLFLDKDDDGSKDAKTVGGARPTSGKHYSRHFDNDTLSQYLHKAT
jgi:hypothetical protein